MDRPIGDVFKHNDATLKVVKTRGGCVDCFFGNKPGCCGDRDRDITGNCSKAYREDKNNVSFIKIEENMFTKDDLKTGMIVEYKSGEKRLVIRDGIDILTSGDGGWTSLNNSDETLKSVCCTIVKVYEGYTTNKSGTVNSKLEYPGNLIWERDKEKVELTLEQIAEKFNIPVDSLRIKD